MSSRAILYVEQVTLFGVIDTSYYVFDAAMGGVFALKARLKQINMPSSC